MPNLEPTYLRYVYDSLNKGSLNAENAAALPRGFIGLYEQEFTQKTPADERERVLSQLALWALFKGPVSANMAAAVLELEEDQIKDLVDTYSSWFNSPESGKYQLYHERLRVYLLQKLKAEEVQVLNEKLISFLEDAIKQAKGEEDEYYALEHLHRHMALESQLGNHYERLHSYVNQESLWRRQIQLSKGYVWSQNSVQQGIKEGARRNHEMNTIRSTVNSVKLMTQEQNSAEDILNLLNDGDYITALKRAESWEGERQFKLYLLFIHELTIGTSKEADFRKEACKAVLEAIDQTPEDHSVLDWCTFYPELAIYKYHVELLKMELDALVIWKRGKYILSDIFEWNFEIVKSLATEITDDFKKSRAYREISKVLMDHGEKEESQEAMKESLKVASEITNPYKKSKAYREISKILIEHGDMEDAKKTMQESLKVASEITDSYYKSEAYRAISKFLMEQGKKEESLRLASGITDQRAKSKAYADISKVLIEQGQKEEANKAMRESLHVASEISDKRIKSEAFLKISKVLMEHGDKGESKLAMQESLLVASEITHEFDKSQAFANLSKALIEQREKEESLRVASKIKNEFVKSEAYANLSKVLMDQRYKLGAKSALKESLRVASKISNDYPYEKSKVYALISKVLIQIGEKEESLRIASEISFDEVKSEAFATILNEQMELGDFLETKSIIIESLVISSVISVGMSSDYEDISEFLIKSGKREKSISIASQITSGWKMSRAYTTISKVLIDNGEWEESLRIASQITNDDFKSEAYTVVLKVLMEQQVKEQAKFVLKESFRIASEIGNVWEKTQAYLKISKVLLEQGNDLETQFAIKKIHQFSSEISDNWEKASAYAALSEVMMKQGDKKESLGVASEIIDDGVKSIAYASLSKVLMEQGDKEGAKSTLKESNRLASEITDYYEQSNAYMNISKILMEKGKMKEALILASDITDDYDKSEAYIEISKLLLEKGKMKEAIQVAENINQGSEVLKAFIDFGKIPTFKEAQNCLPMISSENNQGAVVKGMSEKIYKEMELSEDIYPYLYHHSKYTENLSYILFHQAKMACFFEEERNEEKLDMLSEVLDIKDWRRISASA